MRDLGERFAELDLLEAPEMRSSVDTRIADRRHRAEELPVRPVAASRWKGPLVAIGAAAAVVIALLAVVILPRGAWFVEEPPTEPSVTTATTTTSVRIGVAPGEVVLEGLIVPHDVEYDPTGGLVFSETDAGRVSRVEIRADGSPGEVAVLATGIDDAEGLALSSDGTVYVAGGDTVYRVSDGVAEPFAAGFNDPEGLAFDAEGNLFVSDDALGRYDHGAIRVTKLTMLPDGTAGERSVVAIVPGDSAKDIEFGPDGDLYVANSLDAVWVIRFAPDGSTNTLEFVTFPGEQEPSALAFNEHGVLYVGMALGPSVWRVGPSGEPEVVLTGFFQVEGLAFDRSGSLYVVEVALDQLLRFGEGSAGAVSIPNQVVAESDLQWDRAGVDGGWTRRIVDVASLPEGGFVAAATANGSVLWSRDGTDWFEADPDGLVSDSLNTDWLDQAELDLIAPLPGDRVAILAASATGSQVWMGDLAQLSWESIQLDTDGTDVSIESMAIAANSREVLVVAEVPGPNEEPNADSIIWIIDAEMGTVERQTLSAPTGDWILAADGGEVSVGGRVAAWLKDRWVVAIGNMTAVSADGASWTFGVDPDGLASYPSWVTSLSAGTQGILATTCGGLGPHDAWFSADGLEWTKAPGPVPGTHSGSAYSDALGFVLLGETEETSRLWYSLDGANWSYAPGIADAVGIHDIAVSGRAIFVARERVNALLLTPR